MESQDNYSLILGTFLASSNSTSAVAPKASRERQWVLPAWIQLVYGVMFGTIVFAAVFGNALVIWSVLSHRRMRTVTNHFLVNLSVADTMTAVFNAIFNLVYMLESHWAFGEPYCVFSNFMANLTVASSAFTMAAMSIDRYFAIVRPLCGRLSRCHAAVTIGTIWGASGLLALPTLLFSRTKSYRYGDNDVRIVCLLVWPDGPPTISSAEYLYNVFLLILTYIFPVVTMAATYARMSLVLWGTRCIGEFTEHQQIALRNKQKVVRMLFTVVALFAVCWLPYHIYFLYVFHHPHVAYLDHIQHVYLAMYWLAMSHAMYNPIIYYFMNSRFHIYFRQFMCRCCKEPEKLPGRSLSGTVRSSHINMGSFVDRLAVRFSRRSRVGQSRHCHKSLQREDNRQGLRG
ncbi:tachykinin-like peptides receptor 86C [Ixodes scapularis]|uniref:tachykinin-like peptides receptor 86C n=1 Tax=Ixodes scapularis TaxID=6945 RepID=UPI001A9DB04F|nr:tachykinin-like peptides receptor 86C [Ixodes scapularis]